MQKFAKTVLYNIMRYNNRLNVNSIDFSQINT